MSQGRRQVLLNLARVLISASLLAVIITGAGWQGLWQAARSADWRFYMAAIGLISAGMVVRALRWQIVLRAAGVRIPFRRAWYLYYVGSFFNVFLPTGFGGDVVRVLEFGAAGRAPQAAGTIIVERLMGFDVLFVLAIAALPFAAGLLPPALIGAIALLAAGVLAASAILLDGRLLRLLVKRIPWLPHALSLAEDTWLGQASAAITASGPRALAGAAALSLVYNLLLIFASALLARALGLAVPLWAFAIFVPLVTVSLLVPITISGFGVREGIFILLFAQVGLDAAQAVAPSLAWYSLDLADGLVGGALYLLGSLRGLRKTSIR